MGVQSMVKHAMGKIKKNKKSNIQAERAWDRRVTEIVADLEQPGDTAKKAKFEQLVTKVAAEFAENDLQARTGPDVFLKRQKAIIEAEAPLNEFKAPLSDRDAVMKEAVKKPMPTHGDTASEQTANVLPLPDSEHEAPSQLDDTVFKQCDNLDFLSFSGGLLVDLRDTPPPIVTASTQHSVNPLHPVTSLYPMHPVDAARSETNEKGHDVMLPYLQWMRAGAITMHGLSQLVTPHVRFLVIGTALRDYTKAQLPPHSIVFPEVEVLHVSSVHSHIAYIVAPELQTLCLQLQVLKKSDANDILRDVFDGDPQMLKPENLSFSTLAHDKYIVAMVKKLKDIKTLTPTLNAARNKEEADEEDQPKKALFDALKRATFVPALTSFTLDLQSTTDENLDRRQGTKDRMEEVQATSVRNELIRLCAKWAVSEQVFVQCEKCNKETSG